MRALVRALLNKVGYALVKTSVLGNQEKRLERQHFFDTFFKLYPSTRFVQIGAHDGLHGDPLHDFVVKYDLKGVCVEPQPDVYKKLVETYAGREISCVRAAVGDEVGYKPFYTIKESLKTPENFEKMTRLASFDRAFVLHHLGNRIPKGADPVDYIEEIQVPVLDINDLVEGADFIQIDTEGYDGELIKALDLSVHKPRIINYESVHLSREDKAICESKLTSFGYEFFNSRSDTTAYLVNHKMAVV